MGDIKATQMLHKHSAVHHNFIHFYTSFLLVFFSLGIITISSCTSSDTDKDGIPDDKDKCPAVFAKTGDGCLPEHKINTVRFFIDRSGSMNGYYHGGTGFVNSIVDLLAKIENIRPVKEIWLVGDGAEKFGGDAAAFRDQMPRTLPKGEKSSMMADIFQTIAGKTDSDDISIFVSDGILSYSDTDIKKDKNINKDKAGALSTAIYTTFGKLRKNHDFGASIYAFKSAFNGIYYNYRNDKIWLAGEQRPYFIWIIGQKKLLKKFNAELSGISTFKPEQQLHFGLEDEPVTKAAFIPSIERKGRDWQLNEDGKGIKDIGKESATFCVALDLSSFPIYVQQLSYLRQHIHLDNKGCIASVQIKNKEEADKSMLRSNRQKEDFESSTHLFIIQVKQMNTTSGLLNITLPAEPDTWYKNWSCDDDLNLKEMCTGQTFAFSYLVDGVIQAYQANKKNYIDLSIPLQQ